jgi:imidazolonepropionase-like amidohydrolase
VSAVLRTLSRAGGVLLLYILTCVSWATAQSDAIVFVGGTVLTQDPQRPLADAVALRGGRIVAVGRTADVRRSSGAGSREVDLRGRTLIPGLIDAHVHLGVADNEDESVVQAARTTLAPTLSAYLSHGVTTVRTAGGRMPQSAELRDLLESGEVIGPRLVLMGPPFSAPGGHPGVTVCRNNPRCRAGLREVSDEGQARAYVREPSNRGISTLKVIANFIPDANIGRELPSIPDSLLAAIADEAHKNGLRVGAHVADTATMIRMIGMGYDQFMHLPDTISAPDDMPTLARMLAEKRISVTTTLALRDSYRDASGSERRVFGTPYGDETRRMFEQMLRTALAFHAAGVPLVVGTDCCQGTQIGDPRLQPGARAIHEMDLLERARFSSPRAAPGSHTAAAMRARLHRAQEQRRGRRESPRLIDERWCEPREAQKDDEDTEADVKPLPGPSLTCRHVGRPHDHCFICHGSPDLHTPADQAF